MSVEKRVARGVALLDREAPGWDQRINLDRLDIGCRKGCIVGQLFGSFNRDNVEDRLGINFWSTPKHGLAANIRYMRYKRELRDWNALTDEWTRVIVARREGRRAAQWAQLIQQDEEHRAALRSARKTRELVGV